MNERMNIVCLNERVKDRLCPIECHVLPYGSPNEVIDRLIDCTNCSTTISSSHPWTISWFCDKPRRWSVFHPIFGVLLQKVTDCQRRKTQKEVRHSLKFGGVQYAVSQRSQILFYRILSLAVQMTVSNVCIYTWIKVSWVTFVCICAFFYLGPFVLVSNSFQWDCCVGPMVRLSARPSLMPTSFVLLLRCGVGSERGVNFV